MKTKPHLPLRTRLVALAALLALPLHSPAADFTWNGGGGDGNFSTGLNWVGGSPAVSDLLNTNLIFGGTLQLAPIVDSPFSANVLTFDNTAGAFTFGGSALSLGSGGIVNNSTNTMTFGNAVSFSGTSSSTINAASGGLIFNNTVTLPTGTLTVSGTGLTQLSGASASLAIGTGQTLQVNSDFTLDAGAQLTHSSGGTVTLAAGKTMTVQNGGDASFTGDFTNNTTSTITVTGAGSTLSTTGALRFQGGGTLQADSGASVNTNGGAFTLGSGSASGTATFANGSSGSFGFIGVNNSATVGSSGTLTI